MYHGGSKYRTSPEFAPADHPHDADGSGIGLSIMRIDGALPHCPGDNIAYYIAYYIAYLVHVIVYAILSSTVVLQYYCAARCSPRARFPGFISLDSIGSRAGTLTTSLFTSPGTQLFVNLRAMLPKSAVTVEVLQGGTGKRLAVSEAMSGDKPRMQVVWAAGGGQAVHKGAVLQLRFTLARGSIYSWWVAR